MNIFVQSTFFVLHPPSNFDQNSIHLPKFRDNDFPFQKRANSSSVPFQNSVSGKGKLHFK